MEQETSTSQEARPGIMTRLTPRSITLAIAGVIIITGGIGYYFFSGSTPNTQQAQQQEIQELVAAVGKLMVLPAGEQPVIATVADPEKLKDQPFFANAKKGAKVLIYNTARKAILYDPAEKRIVDVAPLNVGSTATPAPQK